MFSILAMFSTPTSSEPSMFSADVFLVPSLIIGAGGVVAFIVQLFQSGLGFSYFDMAFFYLFITACAFSQLLWTFAFQGYYGWPGEWMSPFLAFWPAIGLFFLGVGISRARVPWVIITPLTILIVLVCRPPVTPLG